MVSGDLAVLDLIFDLFSSLKFHDFQQEYCLEKVQEQGFVPGKGGDGAVLSF